MARKSENTGFICKNCNQLIQPVTNGCYRNHCPFCLFSVHVDNIPGDRGSTCHGLMKPIGLNFKSKKGWQILHQCLKCGIKKPCRIAKDTVQPDDNAKIARVNER